MFPLRIKCWKKLGEEKCLYILKARYDEPVNDIILNEERQRFLQKSEMR